MKISGLILAGGKSTRMGVHKGGLKLKDATFTEIIAGELKKLTADVTVSCVPGSENVPDWCRKVYDIYENCGPLGGLHAAMENTDGEVMLVSACDTPFVRAELYRLLLGKLESHDGVVAVAQCRMHPLTAVYRKSMAEIFAKQLSEGNYRMRDALDKADILYFSLPKHMVPMVKNINTPEEYEQIEA